MKTGKKRIVYWDTTVWLAWLHDERCWPVNIIIGIQDSVAELEDNETVLLASTVIRGEIFLGTLGPDQRTSLDRLLRRRNVIERAPDSRIMNRVSAIREYHSDRGRSVMTPDAIHLATAIHYRADEFLTMDGLQKGGSKKRKLLALNGDVGGFPLRIVHPYPRRSPPSELKTVVGPLFGSDK